MTKIVNFAAKKAELNKRYNEVELAKAAGCEGQVISKEIKEESTRQSGKIVPFPRQKVTYIETCAGIGATSLALKEVGEKLGIDFTCIAYSEIDDVAIRGYKEIHGPTLVNVGDVTKINWKI